MVNIGISARGKHGSGSMGTVLLRSMGTVLLLPKILRTLLMELTTVLVLSG
ncbi:MAG: hypothetical protein K6T88_12410 [Bacillus sp. (in: Bacteria)]|nr:hypothetical protein [Bacillus sp. (in: firmicutes)]